jgi:cytochrome P450
MVHGKNVFNLFSKTDGKEHARERRPVARYYTVANITTLEPHMDKVIDHLCRQLDSKSVDGRIDLGRWLTYCTFPLRLDDSR